MKEDKKEVRREKGERRRGMERGKSRGEKRWELERGEKRRLKKGCREERREF